MAGSAAAKSGEGRGDDRGPEGGNCGSRKAKGLGKGGAGGDETPDGTEITTRKKRRRGQEASGTGGVG